VREEKSQEITSPKTYNTKIGKAPSPVKAKEEKPYSKEEEEQLNEEMKKHHT